MKRLVIALILSFAGLSALAAQLGATGAAANVVANAATTPGRTADTRTHPEPSMVCFGGLEDRKLVVPADDVRDPQTQTTRAACRIDGGDPGRAPQAPTITSGRYITT